MPVKERQKLRNQVSAQQSRLKKKEEVNKLHELLLTRDENMLMLATILTKSLKGHQELIHKIQNDIQKKFKEEIEEGKPRKMAKTSDHTHLHSLFTKAFVTKERDLEKYKPNDEREE